MSEGFEEPHVPLIDEIANAFDQILPGAPKFTSIKSNLITYRLDSGTVKVIKLSRTNRYHELIFEAAKTFFQSDAFHHLAQETNYLYWRSAQRFIDWLNETGQETTDANRYDCLKAYEAYFMNTLGFKTSPLWSLLPVIKGGLSSVSLTDDDFRYLQTLLKLSKPVKSPPPESFNLPDWFGMSWLRWVLGEERYLQLESPARVFLSFRVTAAETLLHLLEIREQWQKHPCACQSEINVNKANWYRHWNVEMLNQFGTFDESGEAEDAFSELMFLDFVRPNKRSAIKLKISQVGVGRLPMQPHVDGKSIPAWARNPSIFHPDHQRTYSPLEERLMSWLIACEAVQPSDIGKLKTSDYAREYNQSGRLLAMECCYYKGRSGSNRRPAILMASDCWTKAQHHFLLGLSKSESLFRFNPMSPLSIPNLEEGSTKKGDVGTLWSLWQSPRVQRRIRAALKRAGGSSIFLDAAMALTHASEPYTVFRKRTKRTFSEYYGAVARPLPLRLFSLTHVKNTAVFAGSDLYRDGDLINHHSHTSETEKHAYLTDSNKDFVNRAGRITRLVLHDLQNVVYQPSISALSLAVNDLELRTRVIDATGSKDVQIHSIEQPVEEHDTTDVILVPDTVEQALLYLHTIAEAEERLSQLLAVRPDWVERTLLVRVEWMTRNLSRMRSAKEAEKQYKDLKPHLPALFKHLLETVE
tara:strand:- start:11854 stop:13944 length:2091 start_codon:yes stop_codon:yes gene_type:complete